MRVVNSIYLGKRLEVYKFGGVYYGKVSSIGSAKKIEVNSFGFSNPDLNAVNLPEAIDRCKLKIDSIQQEGYKGLGLI